jgi:ATP-dependent DNA helicase PIF1
MLNILQLEAIDIIKSGRSLFLTGPPGVGKSYTLTNIIRYLDQIENNYGLTAMTGCAAILIKGQTLHSFLGIGLGNDNVDNLYEKIKDKNKKKFNELKNLDTLIIDEISMMNDKFFEKVSKLLSKIKNNDKPFGDIRLILIGDFYQLPPMDGEYCFKSKLWDKINMTTVELNESMRQKDDISFQKLLNNIRKGKITESNYNELKKLNETEFSNITPTKIYCLKKDVNNINNYYFSKLVRKNNKLKKEEVEKFIEENTFECLPYEENYIEDNISKIYKYCLVTNDKYINKEEYEVSLIKGAEVMVTRNINIEKELVNGKKGEIINLTNSYVVIKDDTGNIFKIDYYKDENSFNKFVKFMPLTLAYAITVHKSQGSTLDYIEIDGSKNNFAPGQFYTAISRAKTLKNIKLVNLDDNALIINQDVLKFYNKKYISL